MTTPSILAATELNIDPETLNEVTTFTAWAMASLALCAIGIIVWHVTPTVISYYKNKHTEKIKSANSIWFDSRESVLHCGHNNMRIEPSSLEHFVCKLTFTAPSKYFGDIDIFDAKDHSNDLGRGVEQAVRRLNKKVKELGLKNDLFKRSKERTSVNDMYRSRII